MAISSPGLASGIDIQGIVAKLVALERAPLAPLQQQAASFQSKLSIYGTLKSMVSALGDAAAKMGTANAWDLVKGGSTAPDKVGISVAAGTAPTSMSIEVQALAKAQSNASTAVPNGTAVGNVTFTDATQFAASDYEIRLKSKKKDKKAKATVFFTAESLLDGEIDRETAIGLALKYQLISRPRAEQSIRFTETYRSYVINYVHTYCCPRSQLLNPK